MYLIKELYFHQNSSKGGLSQIKGGGGGWNYIYWSRYIHNAHSNLKLLI